MGHVEFELPARQHTFTHYVNMFNFRELYKQ